MRRLLVSPSGEVRPVATHPQLGPVVATINEEGVVEPRPLREVAQEITLADGARAYAAGSGDGGGRHTADPHVVARLVQQAREEGKEEGRALAQAEGLTLRLPRGEALCGRPAVEPSTLDSCLSWLGSGVTGAVAGIAIVVTLFNGGPIGLVAGVAMATWVVWAVAAWTGSVIRARARQRYWSPEVGEDGGYLARVAPDGRVQVRARKGRLLAWRPAEDFGTIVGEEDAEGDPDP